MTSAARAAASTPIHCIGDSHVSFFSGHDRIVPPWPVPANDLLPWFKTHHIGPALAYNLERAGSRSQGRERLMEILAREVPAGGTVLMSFGEIDCRAHLPKQADQRGLPLGEVVADCLDRYFKVLAEVAGMGFRVVVYNAVCSRVRPRTDGVRMDGDFAAYGPWQVRAMAVDLFNTGARERCARLGISFLETVPHLADRRGMVRRWYFFDSIHLSQRAMPATLAALAALLPEAGITAPAVKPPTMWQRLADWLDKRRRRLCKEIAKIAPRRSRF